MNKFGPDPHAFFEGVYEDFVPWDVGAPQPALTALFDEFPPTGPVLDLGCGTGDLAISLAQRGLDVVGIDFVETAITEARQRAGELAPEIARRVRFEVADALRPTLLGERFGAVTDSGFLHVLGPEQRGAVAGEIGAVLGPGGRYYLLAFDVEFPMPNMPHRVSEEELRTRFTPEAGWRILAVRPAQFLSRVQPVAAVAACIERLPPDRE